MPAKSPPRLRRAQDLGAKIYGTEKCKIGATNNAVELRVQILKAYLQGHICEKLSKKKLKNKKFRRTRDWSGRRFYVPRTRSSEEGRAVMGDSSAIAGERGPEAI